MVPCEIHDLESYCEFTTPWALGWLNGTDDNGDPKPQPNNYVNVVFTSNLCPEYIIKLASIMCMENGMTMRIKDFQAINTRRRFHISGVSVSLCLAGIKSVLHGIA